MPVKPDAPACPCAEEIDKPPQPGVGGATALIKKNFPRVRTQQMTLPSCRLRRAFRAATIKLQSWMEVGTQLMSPLYTTLPSVPTHSSPVFLTFPI